MHQWSISLLSACGALCQWRGAIEPMVANGSLEPLVAADLDLVNMFRNAGWPRTRHALRSHFPEASDWTEWQHQSDSVTPPPDGVHVYHQPRSRAGRRAWHHSERPGFGRRATPTRATTISLLLNTEGVCDGWFVDGGQVFVRPWSYDRWLRASDAAFASLGTTRGCVAHGNVKSTQEFQGWDTPYVHDTVTVPIQDCGTTALGL